MESQLNHQSTLSKAPAEHVGQTSEKLQGNLTVGDIFFSVVAWAAPLLVVVGLLPSMIGFAGEGIVVCIAITTLILLLFAVGFTTLTKFVERPGAFYTYIVAGLGRKFGLGGAFVATFSYTSMLLTTWIVFGVFAGQVVHDTFGGPEVAWWAMALIGVLLVAVLSTLRVDFSARVLAYALLLEVAVVVIFDFSAFGNADFSAVIPVSLSAFHNGALSLGILYSVLAFIGFESAALYREETKNPSVAIPRATYLAVIAIGVFYMIAAYAMLVALGPDGITAAKTSDVTTMFKVLSTQYVGKALSDIINILMLTSTFACLLSLHNGVTRYFYSLGKDGVLPKVMGSVHRKHNSPYMASWLISGMCLCSVVVLAAITGFQTSGTEAYSIYIRVSGIATMGILLLMCFVSVAVIAYFSKNKTLTKRESFSTFVATFLSLAGLLSVLVLAIVNADSIVGAPKTTSLALSAIVPVVFIVGYVYAKFLQSAKPSVFQKIGRQ